MARHPGYELMAGASGFGRGGDRLESSSWVGVPTGRNEGRVGSCCWWLQAQQGTEAVETCELLPLAWCGVVPCRNIVPRQHRSMVSLHFATCLDPAMGDKAEPLGRGLPAAGRTED